MKTFVLIFSLLYAPLCIFAQDDLLSSRDTVTRYDSLTRPPVPEAGSKWVAAKSLPWLNSSSFKPYFYNGMAFRLKYPKSYQEGVKDGKKYPIIIFLHGIDEKGDIYDNETQLKWGAVYLRDLVDNGMFDGYLMFPQSQTGGWGNEYASNFEAIVNYMSENAKLDLDKVIVMGISSGSHGAWQISGHKNRFVAACVAISGFSEADAKQMRNYREIPVWMGQGGYDPFYKKDSAVAYVKRFRDIGGNLHFCLHSGLSHICWDQNMMDPEFTTFIQNVCKSNPVLVAGKNTFEAGEPISATLALTPGFAKYEWRKNGELLPAANDNELNIKEPGKYEARLKHGNGWSSWSVLPVIISQKDKSLTGTPVAAAK